MKILIVDDNANDRRLLRLIFERHGFDAIQEAADGEEGIKNVRSTGLPDLIVSDVLMPRMDGFRFLWTLKRDEHFRGIPFVFYSAVYTGFKDEALALRLGADGFIIRPKEPDEFWRDLLPILESIAAGNKRPPTAEILAEEREYLQKYSEVVAGKLEEKVRELEESLARRMKAEETLRKLSLAVEQSPVSIIITDLKGTIEFVNPKFCQITGYAPEEVIGRNPRILKSGETPAENYEALWRTITSGKVWHGELHNKKKNGDLFWESATISPVTNQIGEVSHYLAIKEDITEKKKLQEQLLHSQRMEVAGTLAGGVAHDFNNILTAILGYSDMLEIEMPEADPRSNKVKQIRAAAERAAGLTRSLLAFSRKQPIDTKIVDLSGVVRGINEMLRRLIRENIDLRIIPSEQAVPVLADAGQLEQVLLNLTTNACDAMEAGGSITISVGKAELPEKMGAVEPGLYAHLTFTDTGAGIDEHTRQRMFDPFFTTKDVGKGTGLGLAICYGIIKQHGGYIDCRSEPGKGTTFHIFLPVVEAMGRTFDRAAQQPLRGGSETILVAEDDLVTMDVLNHALTQFGYTVISSLDGQEATALYRKHREDIALCLLDAVMPKKGGLKALEEIRRIQPGAKALLMSGYDEKEAGLDELEKDNVLFIQKPLEIRTLLKKVREALDR